MINEKKVYHNISVLKIIACIMITILHIIGNDGGLIQRCIYHIGSFGIPMFFAVNGYLLYDKDFTFSYYKKKIVKCISFFLIWTVTIGTAKMLITRKPMQLVKVVLGAAVAKDVLYHLWFLITLMLLYTILFIIQHSLDKRKKRIMDLVSTVPMVVILIVMNILFVLQLIYGKLGLSEIRDLIPAPFRLITFGGFFYLGMGVRRYEDAILTKCSTWISVLVFAVSYASICLIMWMTGVEWASSYYSSIFVILGCLALFVICTKGVDYEKYAGAIARLATATTGIWIIHPLALACFSKLLSMAGINFSLIIRIVALVIIDVGCFAVVILMQKIKYIRKYVAF